MNHARSFLTALFLVGSLVGGTATASEDTPSPQPVTSQEVNVLRQIAIALAAGSDAMEQLRGSPIDHYNLDQLKLEIPGMECGIARSLVSVACYGTGLDDKKEAENIFSRMIACVQAALPSDSWIQLQAAPHVG